MGRPLHRWREVTALLVWFSGLVAAVAYGDAVIAAGFGVAVGIQVAALI